MNFFNLFIMEFNINKFLLYNHIMHLKSIKIKDIRLPCMDYQVLQSQSLYKHILRKKSNYSAFQLFRLCSHCFL